MSNQYSLTWILDIFHRNKYLMVLWIFNGYILVYKILGLQNYKF